MPDSEWGLASSRSQIQAEKIPSYWPSQKPVQTLTLFAFCIHLLLIFICLSTSLEDENIAHYPSVFSLIWISQPLVNLRCTLFLGKKSAWITSLTLYIQLPLWWKAEVIERYVGTLHNRSGRENHAHLCIQEKLSSNILTRLLLAGIWSKLMWDRLCMQQHGAPSTIWALCQYWLIGQGATYWLTAPSLCPGRRWGASASWPMLNLTHARCSGPLEP